MTVNFNSNSMAIPCGKQIIKIFLQYSKQYKKVETNKEEKVAATKEKDVSMSKKEPGQFEKEEIGEELKFAARTVHQWDK